MPGSGKRVDYSLRPAKQVERKMMCEAFRRLSAFGPITSYRYVGLGSFYFADFVLFHKSLGITKMFSIEVDPDDWPRCVFNQPFGCIEVKEGHSNDELPKLAWDAPTILWLDYDDRLEESMLGDVDFFCANAPPGSVLVVTVNAHMPSSSGMTERRVQQISSRQLKALRANVPSVPRQVKPRHLRDWGLASVCRTIIHNEIKETLKDRSSAEAEGNGFVYRQLFNFHYRDTARMLTVGGVLYGEQQQGIVEEAAFDELDFIRHDSAAYHIQVPHLTYLERRHLDQQLGAARPVPRKVSGIPQDQAEAYHRICRYFPTFAEVEV